MTYLQTELIDPALVEEPFDGSTLRGYQKLFQLTREEVEQVLRPLAETEQEATGSMGDDTPMAVLSQHIRPLYDCFRQAFAQVTNPPIDPLREDCVMSLSTQLGTRGQHLRRCRRDREPRHAQFAGAVPAQAAPAAEDGAATQDEHRFIDLSFEPTKACERARAHLRTGRGRRARGHRCCCCSATATRVAGGRWCMRCWPPARSTSTGAQRACAATSI